MAKKKKEKSKIEPQFERTDSLSAILFILKNKKMEVGAGKYRM